MAELKFVTLTHYNPHLPEPACIYQGSGEVFQKLVKTVFKEDSELYIPTRAWLFAIQHGTWLRVDQLENFAPSFLKTFLDRYAWGGFKRFILSTTIEIHDFLPKVNPDKVKNTFAELHDAWTAIKINNFILLNMKLALQKACCASVDDNAFLIVEGGDWRESSIHNDWAMLPGQLLCRPDRSLILKFESNLCPYYGNDKDRVGRSLFAWAFWKLVKRLRRFEKLVQKRVELAVYHGRRRAANIARAAKYSDQIGELMGQLQLEHFMS